jgi:replicative DNA helicase
MASDLRGLALTDAVRNAERGVLGACILHQKYLRDLELEVDDFGHLPHQSVFQALRNLEANNSPIDTLSLELQLERWGKLESLSQGGTGDPVASAIAFIGELVMSPPIAENVYEYARAVKDASVKRRVMLAAGDLVFAGRNPEITGDDLLNRAAEVFGKIDGAKGEQVETIGELAERRLLDVERFAKKQAEGGHGLSGCPTGVERLDEKIGGWQFGIVNLIGARPGMGKTALARATADASSRAGMGAHSFSLEDSWHAFTDRELAVESGVSAIRIRQASFKPGDMGALYNAMAKLKARKNWIVDHRGGLSAAEIVRSARRNAEKNGTRVVIVDYLQLVRWPDPRMREDQAHGATMLAFAEAAKADDMAYVVLSQFNRELEKRPDRRPQLSDLRGSGEIEEKCKLAVGLYRGAYYGGKPKRDVDYECECPEAVKGCSHAPTLSEWEATAQLLILKGGNGPTGRVFANWSGPTTRIW